MQNKIPIAELLAHRDGEPVSAETAAAIAQAAVDDPTLAAQVDQLREIKRALNDLPPPLPEPGTWDAILERQAQRKATQAAASVEALRAAEQAQSDNRPSGVAPATGGWKQYRLATAAGVFMAALLGSLMLLPGQEPAQIATQLDVQPPMEGLAHWVDRSRQLEVAVQSSLIADSPEPNSTQRALLFRIADLDAELNSLQEESMHPDLKKRLWQQRVELLETLMEIQRYQMLEEADL